jgi:hypothetical protein
MILPHPTSVVAKQDREHERENLARVLRTSQMMREHAREQINPTQTIDDISNIEILLRGSEDKAGNPIPMEREVIAALRARADIKFRLLSKVLPDLKATESVSYSAHDHMHQHEHANVSNMELAQRLQLWRREHKDELTIDATFTETDTQTAPEGGSKLTPEPEYDFL